VAIGKEIALLAPIAAVVLWGRRRWWTTGAVSSVR